MCVPQGELTITTDMEDLSTALFYDTVPDSWVARAYPSMMGLAAWYADLLLRIRVRTGFGGATACSANLSPGPKERGWGAGVCRGPRHALGTWAPECRHFPLKEPQGGLEVGAAPMARDAEALPAGFQPLMLSNPRPDSEGHPRQVARPHVRCVEAPVQPHLRPLQELEAWTTDFALPTTVWLAGFFNPQSFLTAIMQSMARKNEWPLDKMCLSVEVTKKNREDMTAPPREGSYVYGLFMEGSWRWWGGGGPCGLAQVCLLRVEASVRVPHPCQTQGRGGLAGHLLGDRARLSREPPAAAGIWPRPALTLCPPSCTK